MKLALKVHVPTPGEITSGLDVDADPAVVAARERVDQAKSDRQRAEERVTQAAADVVRLRSAVTQGEGHTADLEAALNAHRAALLLLSSPPFHTLVDVAAASMAGEIDAAKARVVTEATKRRDALQQTADQIAPVLNALRDAEAALDAAVQPCGLKYGVPPVEWPSSLESDGGLRNAVLAQGSVFRPPAA